MKTNFVATWRPEASKFYKNTDAQKVAEELMALGEKFEAKDVVEMAKNEATETHKLFEWNDTIAAEKYRISQVPHIMHDLHIKQIGINKKGTKKEYIGVPIRAFFSLKEEIGYRQTLAIIKDESLHDQLLMTARSELNAFMIKYSMLTELEPVFKAIRDLDNPPAA